MSWGDATSVEEGSFSMGHVEQIERCLPSNYYGATVDMDPEANILDFYSPREAPASQGAPAEM